MNDIEQALSASADTFQTQLDNDPNMKAHLALLLKNNQQPHVMRILNEMPNPSLLTITVSKHSDAA